MMDALSFTSLLIIFSFIFFLVKGLKRSKSLNNNKNLPPSVPGKLPLIGNMHQLVGAYPNRVIRELNEKYGPVIHLQLGEISMIAISSREAAKEVMRVNDPACAGRSASMATEIMWYNHTDIAFSPYNAYWRQMRKVCVMELLSPKMVRSFGSIRLDETSHLVKSIMSISSGKPINLTPHLFLYSSALTCRVIFGHVVQDRETLIMLVKDALAYAVGLELVDFFPSSKLLQAFSWKRKVMWRKRSKLDVAIDSIIDEHKENLSETGEGNGVFGGEDLVDVLIRLQNSGELRIPINNDNIKAVIFDIFAGGTETSSTTMDWAMAEMMRNPHVMTKAQEEIRQLVGGKGQVDESDLQKLKYLKLVIKETLRLHTPTPMIPRECQDECEVDGYTIPRKTKVLVNVWALARDPRYWDEAETFKPERFEDNPIDFLGNNFELLPFGAGRRVCPGISFGLANIELVLANLLYHFDWALPHGTKPNAVDMTEASGLTLPRKNGLYLIPTPYKP